VKKPAQNKKTIKKIIITGFGFYAVGLILILVGVFSGFGSPSAIPWINAGVTIMSAYGAFALVAILVLTNREQNKNTDS
jgi:multisubunit Na+/H+ antiporter MnhC subunit